MFVNSWDDFMLAFEFTAARPQTLNQTAGIDTRTCSKSNECAVCPDVFQTARFFPNKL